MSLLSVNSLFKSLRLKGKLTELFVDVVVIHRKGDFFLLYEQLGLALSERERRKGYATDGNKDFICKS